MRLNGQFSGYEKMEGLAELEKVQTQILRRISDLEVSLTTQSCNSDSLFSSSFAAATTDVNGSTTTEDRLSSILRVNAVRDFSFKRVPFDYYDWSLEARRDILGAASVRHLCKSIVLVNTQAPADVSDCSNQNYSKYYVVVVQYTARFNAETVKNFLYTLNDGKISKKRFNKKALVLSVRKRGAEKNVPDGDSVELFLSFVRLAPEETSMKLTGFKHNGVTCIGMKTDIPVILDEPIVKLNPDFFWLGGGEVDLKLGIRTPEFIDYVKPFIINCSGN